MSAIMISLCVCVRLLCARMCLAVASVRVRVRASTAGENAPPARTQPPRRAKQAGRGCPFCAVLPQPLGPSVWVDRQKLARVELVEGGGGRVAWCGGVASGCVCVVTLLADECEDGVEG